MPSRPVIVIDFGALYAQLIARRVREAHVYSEIMPHTASVAEVLARDPQAIILSGGPQSVYASGAPQVDPALFAPAEVWVSNLDSGRSWHAGGIDMALLRSLWLEVDA